MSKMCYNYESGQYEDIDKDGYSYTKGVLFIIGIIVNMLKNNVDVRKNAVDGKKSSVGVMRKNKTVGKTGAYSLSNGKPMGS